MRVRVIGNSPGITITGQTCRKSPVAMSTGSPSPLVLLLLLPSLSADLLATLSCSAFLGLAGGASTASADFPSIRAPFVFPAACVSALTALLTSCLMAPLGAVLPRLKKAPMPLNILNVSPAKETDIAVSTAPPPPSCIGLSKLFRFASRLNASVFLATAVPVSDKPSAALFSPKASSSAARACAANALAFPCNLVTASAASTAMLLTRFAAPIAKSVARN
ncbi:hypothetical protein Xbed_03658 [Xenorhabdus beddingii]|uniref:Uncharacterized protein n=1 Tax=Xenorhabdus beddingii TaxID=40578 RepID=A0A1Y2S968_9GAMM|nr:hypothetical protein Xbed_03658 [Xenorhabdus beddingii]